MHQLVDLKVLYFGTPVVLISTRNPDGTANLAPMSSAWWLGDQAMLGMNTGSQTTRNLMRERECVLNLPSADLAGAVDRLALLTGSPELSPHKIEKGYRYEPDKFGAAGLTPRPATWSRRRARPSAPFSSNVSCCRPSRSAPARGLRHTPCGSCAPTWRSS